VVKQKSQPISKQQVFRAFKKVRVNRGCAGVDHESLESYENKLSDNLYKLWNRLSSGSYFPPAVLEVEIPKNGKGIRKLGIPTVSDRIAQMVVKDYLEPSVDPEFHLDSYGYRPHRSAHEAIVKARDLCWKSDWVIDLDIKGFFDNLDHRLLLKAVKKHCQEKWVLMYIERWLKAPVRKKNGELVKRTKGIPQGGVVSPLLANIFLHHAFDRWITREFPTLEFERYADDIIVHCKSLCHAEYVLNKIDERLRRCELELHPEKTKIVYCKDSNRKGNHGHTEFTFLGYTFRGRRSKSPKGKRFQSFSPAISKEALKKIDRVIRRYKVQLWSSFRIEDIAKELNPKLRGWINYYGKFRKSELRYCFHRLNVRLLKWAQFKYKKLRGSIKRVKCWLKNIFKSNPYLFVHWSFGVWP